MSWTSPRGQHILPLVQSPPPILKQSQQSRLASIAPPESSQERIKNVVKITIQLIMNNSFKYLWHSRQNTDRPIILFIQRIFFLKNWHNLCKFKLIRERLLVYTKVKKVRKSVTKRGRASFENFSGNTVDPDRFFWVKFSDNLGNFICINMLKMRAA